MATKKESAPKKAAPKKPATKKPAVKKAAIKPAPETGESLYERIAKKAYEIYESRGREIGRDIEHWLEAEKIIKGKKKAK
ncbi:MAG: DUF2934 domain-containing protein [Candidatus Dadabacteria bacterium]|jgi:hypothetical protein|nr:DUF2934 domain-containing protein [Candidatus Dadabacteria bacterium]